MIPDLNKFEFQSDRILSSLTESEKKLFLNECENLRFKKGKLLFYEGGIPTGVFIIESGKAKIYKTGIDGKDQIFYIYNSGDLMGYHALLCDEKYEDSCETLEESRILFVSKSKFEKLCKLIPSLNTLVIQNMSHEFGVLVNTITILAQKSLRDRLALYLLFLDRKYADNNHNIRLPREDLANIIGTSRESLGRTLKEFKEDKLIEIISKDIQVLNKEKLLKIASSIY